MSIHIIGIGLDGAVGLTEQVREIISNATLLIGSDRHLSYFPTHPAQRLILGDFTQAINLISTSVEECIAILVSGDPLFFGLGRLLLLELPAKTLTFHPHLSAVQLAFSAIKVPWQDACFVSIHGRSSDQLVQVLQQGKEKIAVLTDGVNTPRAIAQLYLALDLPTNYKFWVCENLGGETEQVNCFWASELVEQTFAPLNVVVLLRQETATDLDITKLPLFGISDRHFLGFSDRPGLMTKREIRVLVLGELALQSQQIVWDIGAGTGSVSIEIARLCSNSQVYAIEKTAVGYGLITQNCRRFQVENITAIQGDAPDILKILPNPDRIFIGGSGGNLTEILNQCDRLSPQGVIVLAIATLEHLTTALSWLGDRAWNYWLLQVQLSRSVPVAHLTRFSPLNPVTIITATPATKPPQ
ncbi:bifunctional cobalt-precorrin-7 (C(5))-methyltransferase/cobalt-precorrin-6B (C(15))-methyltransferase [Synechocystis sp. PCC 7509]|uniref:bifunctional cobalt-precorrin-7 (C(5))-methyltransferase/cobalt-precorrin-6B (C(15))-methyltransferase n=1 Tax=Synechocystis sp. PCC 7509 TaxID=927677 RepID=UPI0002ACCBC5|nr:bifunctional cobalt-precorrin-7 (C(5))-methyltransferase/cobalt-precorrin-6B (C(15))-methyltransferase [Synechocystis sp. PCC 7509]